MSQYDTSIQEQLSYLGWSIDNLIAHAIVLAYEGIGDQLSRDYPGGKNYTIRRKIKFQQINDIPISRQTICNVMRGSHKPRYDTAILIRDAINNGRLHINPKSHVLSFAELGISIYRVPSIE